MNFVLVQCFSLRKTNLKWLWLFMQHKGQAAKHLNVFLKIYETFKHWLVLHLHKTNTDHTTPHPLSGRKTSIRWHLIISISVWADCFDFTYTKTHQHPHMHNSELQTAHAKFILFWTENVLLFNRHTEEEEKLGVAGLQRNPVFLPHILKGSCLGPSTIHLKRVRNHYFCTTPVRFSIYYSFKLFS